MDPSPEWRELIKKVWKADPLLCPKCKKEKRIVSLIDGPAVIERILRHLGLWQQGIRVASVPAPPVDWVIEPFFDDATPDYDTDQDPIYANGSSIAAGPVCLLGVRQKSEMREEERKFRLP